MDIVTSHFLYRSLAKEIKVLKYLWHIQEMYYLFLQVTNIQHVIIKSDYIQKYPKYFSEQSHNTIKKYLYSDTFHVTSFTTMKYVLLHVLNKSVLEYRK